MTVIEYVGDCSETPVRHPRHAAGPSSSGKATQLQIAEKTPHRGGNGLGRPRGEVRGTHGHEGGDVIEGQCLEPNRSATEPPTEQVAHVAREIAPRRRGETACHLEVNIETRDHPINGRLRYS